MTEIKDSIELPDVQNTKSNHQIYLPEVGIEGLVLPIKIKEKPIEDYTQTDQRTVATISVYADLKPTLKGISMSRLLEVVHAYSEKSLTMTDLQEITEEVRKRSESNRSRVIYTFPFFIKKNAPASGIPGLINHQVSFECINYKKKFENIFHVEVLGTSLCPCSK